MGNTMVPDSRDVHTTTTSPQPVGYQPQLLELRYPQLLAGGSTGP